MKKNIVVIGLGRFGATLATTLFSLGHDVLAIDIDEKKVQSMASQITHAVRADATDEAVLRELGVANFDVAVVSVGSSIEVSVLSTILLKKLGVRYIVARAEDELHGSILAKIGADKVVHPRREMGEKVAHGLTLRDVLDYMPLAQKYGVAKLAAPPYFAGKTLSALGFGRGGKWGMAVLLIQRGKEAVVTPDRTEVIRADDILLVAGNDDRLEEMLAEAKSA